MRHPFRRLARFVNARFHSTGSVVLYEHARPVEQSSPAAIVRADERNIADILHFQDAKYLPAFRRFLARGDIGYLAYLDGRCIHRAWVRLGPATVQLHKFAKRPLAPGEAFIQYCETAEEARGKNIYPHVLSRIAADLGEGTRLLISTDESNTASRRGIEKAGFRPIERVRVRVVLGFVRRRSDRPE